MPRENVNAANGARVTVSWLKANAGDEVQLNIMGTVPVPHDTLKDLVKSVSGPWITLDREGINRLIRSLRRARDQAYGQDA
jgi:hypothetical protein